MKYEEIKYVIVTKDEKYWMRESETRYGRRLCLTKIEDQSGVTYQPCKYSSVDEARKALIMYLGEKKTKTAKDFKIILMKTVSQSIEDNEVLPKSWKISPLSYGIDVDSNTDTYIKLQLKEILENQYKQSVLDFEYDIVQVYHEVFHYYTNVCVLKNIIWQE